MAPGYHIGRVDALTRTVAREGRDTPADTRDFSSMAILIGFGYVTPDKARRRWATEKGGRNFRSRRTGSRLQLNSLSRWEGCLTAL